MRRRRRRIMTTTTTTVETCIALPPSTLKQHAQYALTLTFVPKGQFDFLTPSAAFLLTIHRTSLEVFFFFFASGPHLLAGCDSGVFFSCCQRHFAVIRFLQLLTSRNWPKKFELVLFRLCPTQRKREPKLVFDTNCFYLNLKKKTKGGG